MKKRILSILLTLVMVIGMLPTVAFAATEKTTVTQIELTGVYLPKVGNPCATKDEAGVTTPSDAAYEFSPQYYGYWDANGTDLTSATEFEAGRQYYTQILVRIKDDFEDTHAFSADSKPTITFTDLDESLYKNYSVSFLYIEDGWLKAKIDFTLAGDNAYSPINTLVLDDYKTPVNGQTLFEWYYDSNVPEYNNSKMTSLKYLMPDGTEYYGNEYHKTMYTQVETGEKYGLEMKFKAVEEYTFADVVNISVASGNPTITYDVSDDKKTMTVKLMEEAPGPDITSIEFGLISEAAVINGNTVRGYADYWIRESSDKYYADFNAYWYEWKDEDGNIVTGEEFENGKNYIGNFDFSAETGHSFADDVTINITSGGKYVSHKVTKNKGYQISLEVTVTPYIPLNFVSQSPTGSDSETTGLSATVGDTKTYTFNSTAAPDGFYVEKKATLKGLFAGLDAEQTVTVKDGSAATLTHTFENAGLYQLKETLKLYKEGESTPVETKTHVFLISVNKKPLVVPEITQQPESVTRATGDSVTLTAKAENAERARWYVEKSDGTVTALGDAFAADGTSTQTISKASNAVGNRYFCAFWSVDGKIAKTDSVTVCFIPTVTDGTDVIVNEGTIAYLKVTESGCNHYADANGWYAPGASSEVSGSKYYSMGTTLCIKDVTEADEGTYTYKYVTEHGDVATGTVNLVVNTGSSSTFINTFDIFGLDNPMIIGTYADTTVSVPENANYTAEVIDCTFADASGVVISSSGTVTIKLTPETGYKFNPNGSNIKGTVDGTTEDVTRFEDSSIIVVVDYNDTSSWKIVYPENDTISISTDSLTFKVGTAANGQKVEGTFKCTHSGLADTSLHHTRMKYAVYSGIADNVMPAYLTLNADGTITGTPTTAGVYTVMVRADSVNANGTASNCSGLAVKAIEIIVESDAHVHDWNYENPDSDSATCTADGEKVISCKNGCSEKITVTSPATGHNWGEWPSYITPRCDEDPITITRTCKNDPSHTEESAPIKGIHMGMDWTTDDSYHWKVCVYCDNALVVEPEAHADTNSDNKCDTCEHDMTPAGEDTPVDPEKTAAPAITYDGVTFTVEATGNGTVKVYVNGVEVTNPYTFEQGKEDVTYTVTATAQEEGKEISETATLEVTVPAKVVTPEPAQKYTITYTDGVDGKEIFADVVFADVEEGSATPTISNPTRSGYTFTGWTPAVAATVTGDQTYTATWDKNSTGGGVVIPTVFPVTVKESDNGEVEASAKYAVPGSTVKLTVTPDEGYELDTLIVKSGSKFINVTEKNGKYQFVMPFGSATVTATFKKIETPVVPVVPTFDDVAEDTYYFDAVEWAVKEGITSGTTASTFSPDMTCTRAQAVTFLWRAAGSPEPKSNVMPFEDIAAEAYYYKAVLWAVENGITKGTSDTTFSPDADCTRAQIVTFLWRAQKSPAADSVNPFTDVAADAYYVDAVLWAVEEKVTKGTSETTFSPDADCTRAQIVTFLYRALNEQ